MTTRATEGKKGKSRKLDLKDELYLEFLRIFSRGYEKGEMAGMKKALLQIMEQRFGPLPEPVFEHVNGITVIRDVKRLLQRVLKAKALADMRLDRFPRQPRLDTLGVWARAAGP